MKNKLSETDLLQKNPKAADIFLINKKKLADAVGSARPQKRTIAPPFERAQRKLEPARSAGPMLSKAYARG